MLAAIFPIVVLCYFIYKKDYNKEPSSVLSKLFIFGFLSVIPVLILELLFSAIIPENTNSFIITFINTFICVGLIEEGFKWIITKKFGYDNKEFDEIYDIIVYSVFASLGFACIENIFYVLQNGFGNAILRAIISIPGHTMFAVFMGYFFAKAKVSSINNNKQLYNKNMILSLLVPSVIHTLFDTFLLFNSSFYLICFLFFDIVMVCVGFITVNKVSKVQNNINSNVASGAIVSDGNGHISFGNNYDSQTINFCPVCGNHVGDGAFCGHCGFRLK